METTLSTVETSNEVALGGSFDGLMKMAEMLAGSSIVPVTYQRRPDNCFLALEMANRMGMPVMAIMQTLYVVQGKPCFSGTAIASMLNNSNKFTNVELNYIGKEGTDEYGAYVTAKNKISGKELIGATVTIGLAKAEGWYAKVGSKWKTIPTLMLAYRAYSFFGRVYAPELLLGFQSIEEVVDIVKENVKSEVLNPFETGN